MAILSVTETFKQRRARVAQGRLREYTRTFDSISSVRNEDPVTVRLSGLPVPYTPYVNSVGLADLGALCKTVDVVQDAQDPYLWRSVAFYSTEVDRPDINQIENPLLRPPEVRFGHAAVARAVFEDRDGEAILNSAGDPYDPGLTEEEVHFTFHITRNLALVDFDPVSIPDFYNAVSSAAYLGFEAGTVCCFGLSADVRFENGVFYYPVSAEFRVRFYDPPEEAWARRVLDQGFYEVVGGNRRIINDPRTARATTTPRLLDGSGVALAVGAAPVFRTHHTRPLADFNELGLL